MNTNFQQKTHTDFYIYSQFFFETYWYIHTNKSNQLFKNDGVLKYKFIVFKNNSNNSENIKPNQ